MRPNTIRFTLLATAFALGCANKPLIKVSNVNTPTSGQQKTNPDAGDTEKYASEMLEQGRETFRYETFGSEQFSVSTRRSPVSRAAGWVRGSRRDRR